MSALTRCPWRVSSSASSLVDLVVQRSGDIGSPRMSGSTRASSAGRSPGSSCHGLLASAAGPTNPSQRFRPGLQLDHAVADRRLADPGRLSDGADPTMAQQPCLGRHQQTPLPLVEVREQHLKLQGELATDRLGDAHTTSTSRRTGSNTLILCAP